MWHPWIIQFCIDNCVSAFFFLSLFLCVLPVAVFLVWLYVKLKYWRSVFCSLVQFHLSFYGCHFWLYTPPCSCGPPCYINFAACILLFYSSSAEMPGTGSPWWLNVLCWQLMLVDPCFISPFWCLEFCDVTYICGRFLHPWFCTIHCLKQYRVKALSLWTPLFGILTFWFLSEIFEVNFLFSSAFFAWLLVVIVRMLPGAPVTLDVCFFCILHWIALFFLVQTEIHLCPSVGFVLISLSFFCLMRFPICSCEILSLQSISELFSCISHIPVVILCKLLLSTILQGGSSSHILYVLKTVALVFHATV